MMSFHAPLSWLVDTSLRVSAAIVLLMLLRPLLRRWIGSGGVALLWLAVAARLLLPWPVESRWSILNYWPARVVEQRQVDEGSRTLKVSVAVLPANENERAKQAESSVASNRPAGVARSGSTAPDWDAWNALWLVGVALGMANLVYRWQQTRRWAAQTFPGSDDPRLAEAFAALPEAHRRGVELRITDALLAPTLAGVIHPQIWMPRAWLDRLTDEELRHILQHELGHARRRDLLAQWVCALACCLHWFNPLVWWAARLARADRELACDAWVLARCGAVGTTSAEYGNTLIKVVQWLCDPVFRALSPAAVTMAAGKRGLSLRVREIGAFRGAARWKTWAAGLLASAIGLLVMTSRVSTAQDKADPSPNAAASATPDASPSPEKPAGTSQVDGAAPVDASAPSSSPAGSAPQDQAPPVTGSPAATPAPQNEKSPIRLQVEIESKIVSISRNAVTKFKAQNDQKPDATGLIDQLAEAFASKDGPEESASPPGVQMVSRIISPAALQNFAKQLNQVEGVDLISAPRVTTKSGQKATIEIIQEFLYPTKLDRSAHIGSTTITTPTNFEKKNVGVTLAVEPNVSPDQSLIDLSISWQQTFLQGYMDPKTGRLIQARPLESTPSDATQPVFSTQTIDTMITVKAEDTVVLAGPRRDPGVWEPGGRPASSEQVLLNLLTVRLIDPRPPLTQARFEAAMDRLRKRAASSPQLQSSIDESMKQLSERYEAGKEIREKELHHAEEILGFTSIGTPAPSVDASGDDSPPQSASSPGPAPQMGNNGLPYAVSAEGKPGFVTSPYAPDSGYVDLRGYTPGQEVRCPYTNKIFLVP